MKILKSLFIQGKITTPIQTFLLFQVILNQLYHEVATSMKEINPILFLMLPERQNKTPMYQQLLLSIDLNKTAWG